LTPTKLRDMSLEMQRMVRIFSSRERLQVEGIFVRIWLVAKVSSVTILGCPAASWPGT